MKRPTSPGADPSAGRDPRIEHIRFSTSGVVSNPRLYAQCRELRQRVFVEEQSVPAALEWDGLDETAEHFAALIDATNPQESPTVVGTARLRWVDRVPEGPGEAGSTLGRLAKAERVAVLASARATGIGRSLMHAVERRAAERGHTALTLNAQVVVVPFYERLGYVSHGDVFLSAGIEHLAMTKRIA